MSTATKTVVSNPAEAYNMFREFCRTTNVSPITIRSSRAKYYTVKQIVDWAMTTKNVNLDRGWFGRALNKAARSGKMISINTIKNSAWKGKPIIIYRNSY